MAMRHIRGHRSILCAVLAVLVSGAIMALGAVAPLWISQPPRGDGRVYGVGVAAISATPAAAIDLASRAARFEILAQLRSSVRAQAAFQTTLLSQQSTGGEGSATRFARSMVSGEIAVADQPLPGIAVEEIYIDDGSRTAYVLASLDTATTQRDCESAYRRLAAACRELAGRPPTDAFASYVTLRRLLVQADELQATLALLQPFIQCGPLCDDAAALQLELAAAAETARRQATCGLDPRYPVPEEIGRIIRAQLEQQGCAWSDVSPVIRVAALVEISKEVIDISGQYGLREVSAQPFYGLRLAATLAIKDSAEVPYDNFSFAVKGVGIDTASARRALLRNFAGELGARLLASEERMFGSTTRLWSGVSRDAAAHPVDAGFQKNWRED